MWIQENATEGIFDLEIRIRIHCEDVPVVQFCKCVHETCKNLPNVCTIMVDNKRWRFYGGGAWGLWPLQNLGWLPGCPPTFHIQTSFKTFALMSSLMHRPNAAE